MCLTELVSISATYCCSYLPARTFRKALRALIDRGHRHQDVKICCKVSFFHELSSKPARQASIAIGNATTVNGRVDYGVGIVSFDPKVFDRRFLSLLIAVEAKPTENLESAKSQLIVFLACQGRAAHGRRDCSDYGVTSDGFF